MYRPKSEGFIETTIRSCELPIILPVSGRYQMMEGGGLLSASQDIVTPSPGLAVMYVTPASNVGASVIKQQGKLL